MHGKYGATVHQFLSMTGPPDGGGGRVSPLVQVVSVLLCGSARLRRVLGCVN